MARSAPKSQSCAMLGKAWPQSKEMRNGKSPSVAAMDSARACMSSSAVLSQKLRPRMKPRCVSTQCRSAARFIQASRDRVMAFLEIFSSARGRASPARRRASRGSSARDPLAGKTAMEKFRSWRMGRPSSCHASASASVSTPSGEAIQALALRPSGPGADLRALRRAVAVVLAEGGSSEAQSTPWMP
eukprot:7233725-Pyramimonas_sp.AAC.1